MKKSVLNSILSVALTLSVCVGGMPQVVLAHGTTDKTITKDMLKTSPNQDYQVDMSVQRDASEGAYNKYFPKEDIQTVSVEIDENNLNYMLQNAKDKPSVMTDSVTIGGQRIGYAGIKTKGNYTLEHSYDDDSGNDRFSFTINFGKYIKKKTYGVTQNFYGCKKISFNNFYFDRSMMKEYFAMKLFSEMGVPTPQYALAKLYINGKYYGVYFMVEALQSSILEQYKKVSPEEISSYLTKPVNTTLQYDSALDSLLKPDGTFDLSSVLTMNGKGDYEAAGALALQAGLWEEDEDTLQDVADMLPTVLSWEKKLNLLNAGKDFSNQTIDVNSKEYIELLNTVMDVDETVRYFAVHSFLVQLDDMFVNQQNFGLYVDGDGKCSLLPWDYDLCFGCYYPGTAEETANYSVDVMYWDEEIRGMFPSEWFNYSEYPIFNVIYQNEELRELYYTYMLDCSRIVLLGGKVSDGETYQPAYFTSYIDKLQSKLEKAASEKLASNVRYHQGASQPQYMRAALPNLSKIMAMRSLGVYNQVNKLGSYVSGNGCDLSTLGNAMMGWYFNSYSLISPDDKTGIFVMAHYGEYSVNKEPPLLTLQKLGKANKNFQAVKSVIGCENEENLTVYKMRNVASPEKKYVLGIPLDQTYSADQVAVYSYTEKETTKLNLIMDGNICFGKTANIQYIAVLKTEGEEHLNEVKAEDDSVDTMPPVTNVKKKIALSKTAVTLKKGKTCQLKLKNAEKKVTWKSANKKIATVGKNGKVTARKKGTTVIKAVSGGKTYRCKVKVKG